jgi:mRNA interferase MazF
MPYQRGDVIELPFLIPGKNRIEVHPAIIISNDMVYETEGIYICVMVTHSDLNDYFAFDLTNDMFVSSKNVPEGKAKAHLIAYVLENQVISNSNSKRNKMRSIYVDKLVHFITDTVLLEE